MVQPCVEIDSECKKKDVAECRKDCMQTMKYLFSLRDSAEDLKYSIVLSNMDTVE